MIFVSEAIDDFYLSEEALQASPSRADGVDADTEQALRRYGCDCIQEAGILLRLPQVVPATAQVLLHRFYCKRSLAKFDVKVAAIAAFWLGCKLEEVVEIDKADKLTLRSVITVFMRITRRRDGRSLKAMDPYSREYEQTKAAAVACERHMLRAFGFIIHVEHPHRFVLNYGQMLALPREVQQEAWNLANDSLRTSLCVRYKAEVVACGILFAATRRLGVPMPEDPAWWELFEVERCQLYDVCRTLVNLHHQPRAAYVCLREDVTSRGPKGQPSPAHTGAGTAAATPLRSPASAAGQAGPASAAASLAAAATSGQEAGKRSEGETEQRAPNGTAPPAADSERQREGAAHPAASVGTRDRERDSRWGSRSRSRSPGDRSPRSQSRERDRRDGGRKHSGHRRRSRSRSRGRGGRSRSRSPRDRRHHHHHHRSGRSERYSGRPPRDDRDRYRSDRREDRDRDRSRR